MRPLILMQTDSATTEDGPRRRARYTWPKPPSPRNRSIRYDSRVSGLSIGCPGARRRPAGAGAVRTAPPLRVVTEEMSFMGGIILRRLGARPHLPVAVISFRHGPGTGSQDPLPRPPRVRVLRDAES